MEKVIENIAKVSKILAYTLCVTFFLASAWVLFNQHVEELTGISVELTPVNNLTMPSLTFCSEEPFRSNGDYYLEDDFVQNTFRMSEIFGPNFKGDNVSQNVTEARSYIFGLCYTVTSLHPVGAHSISYITLTKSRNLKIFIHESGDEFWIIHSFFPVPVDVVAIEGLSKPTISGADLLFRKSESKIVNKKKRKPCIDNQDESFTKCAMKVLPNIFQDNGIHCLTPFWKVLKIYSKMPFCSINQTDAKSDQLKTGLILNEKFIQNPEDHGCPLPCTRHSFNSKLNIFYGSNKTNKFMNLSVYFTSTTVEKKEEYFLYDFINLVSSLGGTMGLLLGHSFLSILLSLINFLQRYTLDAYRIHLNATPLLNRTSPPSKNNTTPVKN